jgi:uncharacterized damage-inducible protein DinB
MSTSDTVLRALFEHKTWATLKLIEFCRSLPAADLDASAPGTYGSVRETLVHLANAETGYQAAFSDTPIWPPLAASSELDAIAERIRALAPGWDRLLQDPEAADRELTRRQGIALGVAPLAQAVHHADDHRTQVLTMLGARGYAVPEPDIWAFGSERGFVRPHAAAPA